MLKPPNASETRSMITIQKSETAVLDFIADCVMAGMARSGSVHPLQLSPELMERAFQNTVELLKQNVQVAASGTPDVSVAGE